MEPPRSGRAERQEMITIGTQFYEAAGDAGARQRRAREALLALTGVHRVNLQFAGERFDADGFETRAVLRQDSRTVTGGGRVRKPIAAEMFDALADAARARDDRYFVYLNADIEVSPSAIQRIRDGRLEGYAFCRVDVEPGTRAELEVMIRGVDMFAVDVGCWERERRRFRPYIAGEPFWDTVYAAILASRGRADIVVTQPGIFHERHPAKWGEGLYAEYNGMLAALDAPYFSRWAHWVAGLESASRTGHAIDRERLKRDVFTESPSRASQLPRRLASQLKARARYALRRPRLIREANS